MEVLSAGIKKSAPWVMPGLLCLIVTSACAQPIDEYQVKAAFLYNFAKFVEWPEHSFKSSLDPIRICVLGRNPFGDYLGNAIKGRDILGRPLQTADVSDVRQASGCHMVFVGASERTRFKTMAAELNGASVLTVGETQGFTSGGGVVNFKLEDGRIRFEINLQAADHAKLRISSKLLNLARIVK